MTPLTESLYLHQKKKPGPKRFLEPIYFRNVDLFWLAGILEGEGSFIAGPPCNPNSYLISVHMTDEDVVARIARMFGASYHQTRKQKEHHKQAFRVLLKGKSARELMNKLRPLMSERSKSQIDKAISAFDPSIAIKARCGTRIIADSEMETIRERHANGESLRAIAKTYGVSHETIRIRVLEGHPCLAPVQERFRFESAGISW